MTQRPHKLDLQTILLAAMVGAQGTGIFVQREGSDELGAEVRKSLTEVVHKLDEVDGLLKFQRLRIESLERENGDIERRVRQLESR